MIQSIPQAIYCDFDGTISLFDGTDAVLEKFALPEWKTWEAQWVAGKITTRECLAHQASCLRVDKKTLEEFASKLPIDTGFFQLAQECRTRNIPLVIVSDGFDVISQAVLKENSLDYLPLYANHLEWQVEMVRPYLFPTHPQRVRAMPEPVNAR